MANRVVEYVICLRREADSPLYKARNPCDLTIYCHANMSNYTKELKHVISFIVNK